MQAAEVELFKSKGAVINVSSIVTLKAGDDDFMMCLIAAKAAQEKVTEVFRPVCMRPSLPVLQPLPSLPFSTHAPYYLGILCKLPV